MAKHLNYGELIEHLKGFGYVVGHMDWKGTPQWVFEHPEDETAIIYMQQRPLDELVHSMHLGEVRATLKAHGFITGLTSETV